MEYLISDLLDTLPEVSLEIKPNTTASRTRIKELTIIKIRLSHMLKCSPYLTILLLNILMGLMVIRTAPTLLLNVFGLVLGE